jgi:hypothetical protein
MDGDEVVPKGDLVRRSKQRDAQAAELERRIEELQVFRDAGVLTDGELEEQKVRLRWRLP